MPMLVALPHPPGTKELIERTKEHGFITFPVFLDNNFVVKGEADVKYLRRWLRKYGMGEVRFAVAPDYKYDEMSKIKKEYPDVNWIFPLHDRDEDFSEFEWVAYPHDEPRRNYDLKTFFKLTEGRKKWYLGYWDSVDPNTLFKFDGFDTVIPSKYGGRFGKVWLDWGKTERVGYLNLHPYEIIEFNIISFKIALRKLEVNKIKNMSLISYT